MYFIYLFNFFYINLTIWVKEILQIPKKSKNIHRPLTYLVIDLVGSKFEIQILIFTILGC